MEDHVEMSLFGTREGVGIPEFSLIQYQLLKSLFSNTRYTKPVKSVKNENLKNVGGIDTFFLI